MRSSPARSRHQVDDIVTVFALKTRVSLDGIFNSSFLPPRGERSYTPPAR